MKKIVFTGGGTAGHVFPNLAIINEVKNLAKVYYIGSNGIEKELVKKNNIEFYEITTTKLKRSLSLSNLLIPFKLLKSINQAKKILKKIKPNIIFSKGGYVALPVVFAAKKLNIPIICHESDMTLGLANKICKNKCLKICTSFEKTAKNLKNGIFTGSPLRQEMFFANKENAKKLFKNFRDVPTILIFGGSLGSKTINNVVFNSLPYLEKYNIIHIVGKNNLKKFKYNNYVQLEFTDQIFDFFALADIIISRAGSNSINEILALNKPNILIPLSKKESRGDQIINAQYFKEKGYSEVITEETLNSNILLKTIKEVLKNKEQYIQNMKKSEVKFANQKIIELLMKNSQSK